jgi:hypothetical protein
MSSQLSDAERYVLLTRILQAAATVVEAEEDCDAADFDELRNALDALPLSERLRYGL